MDPAISRIALRVGFLARVVPRVARREVVYLALEGGARVEDKIDRRVVLVLPDSERRQVFFHQPLRVPGRVRRWTVCTRGA
jgi:hypothetical protein